MYRETFLIHVDKWNNKLKTEKNTCLYILNENKFWQKLNTQPVVQLHLDTVIPLLWLVQPSPRGKSDLNKNLSTQKGDYVNFNHSTSAQTVSGRINCISIMVIRGKLTCQRSSGGWGESDYDWLWRFKLLFKCLDGFLVMFRRWFAWNLGKLQTRVEMF